jgi:hypothetical protein
LSRKESRDRADVVFATLSPRARNQLAKLALRVAAADGGGAYLTSDYQTEALALFGSLAPTMASELSDLLGKAQPLLAAAHEVKL